MQTEENDAPEKIDGKLCAVKPESGCFLRGMGKPGHCGANPHQDIENRPDDGKEQLRRGEPRLFLRFIEGQTLCGEKRTDAADGKGNENCDKIHPKFSFFHKHHQNIVCRTQGVLCKGA